MRRRHLIQTVAAGVVLGPAVAQAAPPRLVVAELFTSQGCSSCPPADALLTDLVQTRPDILLLAYHVTYWDGRGWRDPFSLAAATARQRQYVRLLNLEALYTPQLVVDGVRDVIGSDRPAVLDALGMRRPAPPHSDAAALTLSRRDGQAVIGIEPRAGGSGGLLLVGYDRQHSTSVAGGENGGRTLVQTNIVRSVAMAGLWSGLAQSFSLPAPGGERWAVLLQAPDGAMIGAARETG